MLLSADSCESFAHGRGRGKFASKSRKKNPATGKWFKPGTWSLLRSIAFRICLCRESSRALHIKF